MATTAAAVPAPSTVTNASLARHRHEDEFKTIFEITDDILIEGILYLCKTKFSLNNSLYMIRFLLRVPRKSDYAWKNVHYI